MLASHAQLDESDVVAAAICSFRPNLGVEPEPGTLHVVCEDSYAGIANDAAMMEELGEIGFTQVLAVASQLGRKLRCIRPDELTGRFSGWPVVLSPFSRWLPTAVACGAEVVILGVSPEGLECCHTARDQSELSAALTDVEAGIRRNGRDTTLRSLAVESLFLHLPVNSPALVLALRNELELLFARPPRVSVIINCYNYRDFIRDAVHSALAQLDPADEVIVVDDGSTDGSAQIIAELSDIVPLCKTNGGQASAFNAGLELASGEVVVFLDADDRLLPQAVQTIRHSWRRGLSRLQFPLETIESFGRSTGYYPSWPEAKQGDLTGPIIGYGNYPFMPTSGNAYSADALHAVMPIPEDAWRLCADHYLNILTPFEGEVQNISQVLGQYRVHGRNRHFHTFGGLAFRETDHLRYRVRVWRDLLRHLQRSVHLRGDVKHLQIHRRLLAASADSRTAQQVPWLPEALQAFRLAIAAPFSLAVNHLAYAFLSGVRRFFAAGLNELATSAMPWPWPRIGRSERTGVLTCSTWPIVQQGDSFNLALEEFLPPFFGWGWSGGKCGASAVAAEHAQLAFRLPLHPPNWRISLGLELPAPEALVVFLNDHVIINRPRVGQHLDITLASELMKPEGGWRNCVLTLQTFGGPPLRVLSVQFSAVVVSEPLAPVLSAGAWTSLAMHSCGLALVHGWEWPSQGCVVASGVRARLHFYLPPGASQWMIRFRRRGSPFIPIIYLNGKACRPYIDEDGTTLSAKLENGTSLLVVEFVAPKREPLDLRLESIRADPLEDGGAIFDQPVSPTIDLGEDDAIVTDAAEPWLSSSSFPRQIVLRPPHNSTDCRVLLVIACDFAQEPGEIKAMLLSGAGVRAHVLADYANEVRLPLERFQGSHAILAFGDNRERYRLCSVTYTEATRRSRLPELSEHTVLDGEAIFGATLHPSDWIEPVEGVVWLRGLVGQLAFEVDRTSPLRIIFELIVLPGEGLTVSCESISIISQAGGQSTVSLDLLIRTESGPTVITFRTGTLVPAPGEKSVSAMIGGGVAAMSLARISHLPL